MNYLYLIKIADEFLEKLKSPIYKEFSPYEEFLLELGIIPVQHKSPKYDDENKQKRTDFDRELWGNSLLGMGAYSKVFKVIYKNKPAVAKITDSQKDVDNIKKMYDLSNKVGKYKKHILQIFDIIEFENGNRPGYVIVAEELNPLNKHISDLFNYLPDNINDDKIIKKMLSTLNYKFFANLFIKYHLHKNVSKNNFIELCKESENYFSKINFNTNSDNELTKAIENYKILLKKYFKNNETEALSRNLYFYIDSILEGSNHFPDDIRTLKYRINDYGAVPQKFMPETKSFIEFLLYLNKRFGIKYSDLSDINIMERPSTNDIVISDPGNFL